MLPWLLACAWVVRLAAWEASYLSRICLDVALLVAHWQYSASLRERTPPPRYGSFGSLSGAVLDGIWIVVVLLASDMLGVVTGHPFITPRP